MRAKTGYFFILFFFKWNLQINLFISFQSFRFIFWKINQKISVSQKLTQMIFPLHIKWNKIKIQNQLEKKLINFILGKNEKSPTFDLTGLKFKCFIKLLFLIFEKAAPSPIVESGNFTQPEIWRIIRPTNFFLYFSLFFFVLFSSFHFFNNVI